MQAGRVLRAYTPRAAADACLGVYTSSRGNAEPVLGLPGIVRSLRMWQPPSLRAPGAAFFCARLVWVPHPPTHRAAWPTACRPRAPLSLQATSTAL